jgi:hypothetical protein
VSRHNFFRSNREDFGFWNVEKNTFEIVLLVFFAMKMKNEENENKYVKKSSVFFMNFSIFRF